MKYYTRLLVQCLVLITSAMLAFTVWGAQTTATTKKTVVFIPKSTATNTSFWLALLKGAKDAGKPLGYQVLYKGPVGEQDIAGQVKIVNEMVAQHVSGILISVADTKILAPALENAVKNGVSVITVDSGAASTVPAAYIATDNKTAAGLAADTVAGLIGYKGVVGVISTIEASVTGQQRAQWFLARMQEKYPGIRVLPVQYSACDPDQAKRIANGLFKVSPGLKAFYTACDGAGIGAALAVREHTQGRGNREDDVKVVTFDVSPKGFSLFKTGGINALIVQDPYTMGYTGIKILDQVIKGNPVAQKVVQLPVIVVTQANLKSTQVQSLLKTYPGVLTSSP